MQTNPIAGFLLLGGGYGLAVAARYYIRGFDKTPFWLLIIFALFFEGVVVIPILVAIFK